MSYLNFIVFLSLCMLVGCVHPFFWREVAKISEDVVETIAEDILEDDFKINQVQPYIREYDKLHNPDYNIYPNKI